MRRTAVWVDVESHLSDPVLGQESRCHDDGVSVVNST